MRIKKRQIIRLAALGFCAMSLAACIVQSKVQGRYIDAQEDCRERAESRVSNAPNAGQMTQDQQSAEIVNQFSICMNQSGWHVANPLHPKGEKVVTTDAGIRQTEFAADAKAAGVSQKQAVKGAPKVEPQPVQNAQTTQAAPATVTVQKNSIPPTTAPSTAAMPDAVAPPAHYERTIDVTPAAEDRYGRQF